MELFPGEWNTVDSSIGQLICGFACDTDDLRYSIYLSDLDICYYETLDKENVIARAKSDGIEDLKDAGIRYLLSGCKQSVDNEDLKVQVYAQELEVVVSKPVEWKFRLRKASVEENAAFFKKLNRQHFQKEGLLLHRIEKLHQLLAGRDYYIMFLSQNLKSINGDEVLRKFERNFKEQSELLQLKKNDWQKWTEESYQGKDIWNEIKRITRSPTKVSKHAEPLVKVEPQSPSPVPKIKQETSSSVELSPKKKENYVKKLGTYNLKRERTDEAEEPTSNELSPKKFVKRLGQVSKRKKPN